MSDDFDKERKDLLDRFRESLHSDPTDYFFDEDDLVEIFDYAGDLNNDYLRAEVLMRAARFYPDSEALKQRRIIFYSDVLDPSMRDGFAQDYSDNQSLLAEISFLQSDAMTCSREHALERMKMFLSTYPPFDDEETIRFITLANTYQLLDWVYENYDQVAAHVTNEDVLLYELGYDFSESPDYENGQDIAAELLGRLVEKFPFVADYWQLLASAQYKSEKYHDKYEESLDLALALDPKNREALLLKAQILCSDENLAKKHVDELREICNVCPDDEFSLMGLLSCLDQKIDFEECVTRLVKLLEENPTSVFGLSALLTVKPDEAMRFFPAFDSFSAVGPDNESPWIGILDGLVRSNARKSIETVVEHLLDNLLVNARYQSAALYNSIIDSTFMIQSFDLMFRAIVSASDALPYFEVPLVKVTLAYTKMGELDKARYYLEMYFKSRYFIQSPKEGTYAITGFANIGANMLMLELHDHLIVRNDTDFENAAYNPFAIWGRDSSSQKQEQK